MFYLLNKLNLEFSEGKRTSFASISLYNKTKTEYKINEAGSGYDEPVTCPYSNEWFYLFRPKTQSKITSELPLFSL